MDNNKQSKPAQDNWSGIQLRTIHALRKILGVSIPVCRSYITGKSLMSESSVNKLPFALGVKRAYRITINKKGSARLKSKATTLYFDSYANLIHVTK